MTEPCHNLTPTGRMKSSTNVHVDDWVKIIWDEVRPEMLKTKSSMKCGTSNALDVAEDDALFKVSDPSSSNKDEDFCWFRRWRRIRFIYVFLCFGWCSSVLCLGNVLLDCFHQYMLDALKTFFLNQATCNGGASNQRLQFVHFTTRDDLKIMREKYENKITNP